MQFYFLGSNQKVLRKWDCLVVMVDFNPFCIKILFLHDQCFISHTLSILIYLFDKQSPSVNNLPYWYPCLHFAGILIHRIFQPSKEKYFTLSLSHCVPLPQPGPPTIKMTITSLNFLWISEETELLSSPWEGRFVRFLWMEDVGGEE